MSALPLRTMARAKTKQPSRECSFTWGAGAGFRRFRPSTDQVVSAMPQPPSDGEGRDPAGLSYTLPSVSSGSDHEPFRTRFRVPLTVLPLAIGIVVTVVLWGDKAKPDFFLAATHVLALGAVGMALTGGFFRLSTHVN